MEDSSVKYEKNSIYESASRTSSHKFDLPFSVWGEDVFYTLDPFKEVAMVKCAVVTNVEFSVTG